MRLLGLYPVQDNPPPAEARAEAAHAAGLSTPALDWAALRDYRDYMIRHLDDTDQITGYQKRGVTVIKGTATMVGRDPWRARAGGRELSAEHVVIATGSDPVRRLRYAWMHHRSQFCLLAQDSLAISPTKPIGHLVGRAVTSHRTATHQIRARIRNY